LKIALVSEHANPLAALGTVDAGGQNVYVDGLSRSLADLGHKVDVYCRRQDDSEPPVIHIAPAVRVHSIAAGPRAVVPKDALLPYMDEFASALWRHWCDDPPAVAHAHYWMSAEASMAAGTRLGVPTVVTFHSLGTWKRKHLGLADTSPADRVPAERRLAKGARAVIAVSAAERDEVLRMGASPERVTVIPCGVDVDLFAADGRHPRSGRDGPIRLLAVSRLVPRKGLQDAVAALRHLPTAELAVVGGPSADRLDDDGHAIALRRLAAEQGVGDRLRLLGGMDRVHVAGIMRRSDMLLAVPWYEPFGLVAVEAMSSGIPVVTTHVGGQRETVVDGVTGIWVPSRRPDAIVRAVRRLADSPQLRASMGRAGAARVRELYSWPSIASRVALVYRTAAASRTFGAALLRGVER
jgi:D-inositol-3-phosphate glycosyltransferase